MRRSVRTALSFSLALALGASAAASDDGAAPAAGAGGVHVVFAHPERFTDVRDRPLGGVTADDPALVELARYVQSRAAPRLVAGQTLEVTITDIDRAGQFEPRRGPNFDSVRVVRDVTPPRVDLAFRLLAADGQVVRSGSRQLRDLNFLTRDVELRVDPLRHEKRLLADWIGRDLR